MTWKDRSGSGENISTVCHVKPGINACSVGWECYDAPRNFGEKSVISADDNNLGAQMGKSSDHGNVAVTSTYHDYGGRVAQPSHDANGKREIASPRVP